MTNHATRAARQPIFIPSNLQIIEPGFKSFTIHETISVKGQYYFEGRFDLVRFVKAVQDAGLFVHVRIGPYACAAWNYRIWSEKVYNQDSYFRKTDKYVRKPMSHMESIASSAVRAAVKVKASVIIRFTSSGRAARLISKYMATMRVLSVVIPCLKTNQLRWTFTGGFEARHKRSFPRACRSSTPGKYLVWSAGGATAPAAVVAVAALVEEKKEESAEESNDDMGFSL